MSEIGFVILSHESDSKLERLVATLNQLYDDPPISCHHDFSQAQIDASRFPSNVRFVRPHVVTRWATWSLIEAGLRAIAHLYENDRPEWFVLLSAADYPVTSGERVILELKQSDCDAFLDVHRVYDEQPKATMVGEPNPMLRHWDCPSVRKMKWQRYVAATLWLPAIRRTPRWRLGRATVPLPWTAYSGLPKDFGIFHGDHWFAANAKCADILLAPSPENIALKKHLRFRISPAECYYQSMLCNRQDLRICADNKRYAEWKIRQPHPKTLEEGDVGKIMGSGAHFARKFSGGSKVLDLIDEELKLSR